MTIAEKIVVCDENFSISDKVHRYIIENLTCRRWAPGEKIFEARIARELGISHVPVREAMEKLRQEGWVIRIPNKGIVVQEVGADSIRHLYELREILESGAIRTVATQITDAQIETLGWILEQRDIAWNNKDKEKIRDYDITFHRSLINFAGNPRLCQAFESVLLQSSGLFFAVTTDFAYYNTQNKKYDKISHAKILKSLKRRNPSRAVRVIREHIEEGCKQTLLNMELVNTIQNNQSVK